MSVQEQMMLTDTTKPSKAGLGEVSIEAPRLDSFVGRQNEPIEQGGLLNVVEPPYLIDTFLNNPPLDFASMQIAVENTETPAFLAMFDLLTTLDDDAQNVREFFSRFPFLRRFVRFPTLFVGTTATEYANYPSLTNYGSLIDALLKEARQRGAQLVIIKDVPERSPLLSEAENEKASQLLRECVDAGGLSVAGQALAYVPIDFNNTDEFLARMSKTRRKEFRKKLKDSAHVQIEELQCGNPKFSDPAFLELMYQMYENVFQQSEIHFDVLSRSFFHDLLTNADGGGRVFLYKVDGRLIGYNICFVIGDRLVDKYVGFIYPDARNANLYFLSWFYNLEFAIKNNLKFYIAGWTDPKVKAALGAKFTLTRHAVFIRNPILRRILKPLQPLFESDQNFLDECSSGSKNENGSRGKK
ncbi:MAG: GNAT family N-acetyltransferase [Candidatus Obscuribacterales bacterium]|nr:GNAT family N-acetyltransferase [Candidatus Obscuribacterales bacterium]